MQVPHDLCCKHGLSSSMMALITSDCAGPYTRAGLAAVRPLCRPGQIPQNSCVHNPHMCICCTAASQAQLHRSVGTQLVPHVGRLSVNPQPSSLACPRFLPRRCSARSRRLVSNTPRSYAKLSVKPGARPTLIPIRSPWPALPTLTWTVIKHDGPDRLGLWLWTERFATVWQTVERLPEPIAKSVLQPRS